MKYLVGDFTQLRDDYPIDPPQLKSIVDKKDLVKCRDNSDFQIIDLETKTYFDAENNNWVAFPRET